MKKLFFLLIVLALVSCKNNIKKQENENTYQVISILYNKLAKPIELFFPPPPPDKSDHVFTSKDSVRIDSLHKEIENERAKRKFIVAVYPLLNPYRKGHHKYFMQDCSEFNNVMDKLLEIKDSLKIDIDKIIKKRNDSIIYFKEGLIIKGRRDYETFDILISFSRIAFNKDYTKAVVVGSLNHSTIAGASILYFLEKNDDKWEIKCEKGLSIS
jgi:hypothetical protein